MDMRKLELQRLINSEHGINYHRNINLSGWTFYQGDSFISFELCDINGFMVAKINYVFITDHNALISLLGKAVDFWKGNDVNYIYYREHLRKSNAAEKELKRLGLKLITTDDFNGWQYNWQSTNGFPESEILEAITDK